MNLKLYSVSLLALAALGGSAVAQDSGGPHNWTAFYLGVNLGGAWTVSCYQSTFQVPGTQTSYTTASRCPDQGSFIGGGTFGFNYQFSSLVLGIEGDVGGACRAERQEHDDHHVAGQQRDPRGHLHVQRQPHPFQHRDYPRPLRLRHRQRPDLHDRRRHFRWRDTRRIRDVHPDPLPVREPNPLHGPDRPDHRQQPRHPDRLEHRGRRRVLPRPPHLGEDRRPLQPSRNAQQRRNGMLGHGLHGVPERPGGRQQPELPRSQRLPRRPQLPLRRIASAAPAAAASAASASPAPAAASASPAPPAAAAA